MFWKRRVLLPSVTNYDESFIDHFQMEEPFDFSRIVFNPVLSGEYLGGVVQSPLAPVASARPIPIRNTNCRVSNFAASRRTAAVVSPIESLAKRQRLFDDDSSVDSSLSFESDCSMRAVLFERRMDPSQYTSTKDLLDLQQLLRNCLAAEKGNDKAAKSNSIIFKFGIDMTWVKFSGLHPKTWFNDEVINFYVGMLSSWDENLCRLHPSKVPSYFQTTHFYNALTNGTNMYRYDWVRRWTKKVNVFAQDKLFFPINITNRHWVLCVVFVKERVVRFYDSCGGDGKRYLAIMKRWLQNEYEDKQLVYDLADPLLDEWLFVETTLDSAPPPMNGFDTCPKQTNGYDCGLFVTMCMDYLSANLPLTNAAANELVSDGLDFKPLDQTDMNMFRLKVALSIKNGRLPYSLHWK